MAAAGGRLSLGEEILYLKLLLLLFLYLTIGLAAASSTGSSPKGRPSPAAGVPRFLPLTARKLTSQAHDS